MARLSVDATGENGTQGEIMAPTFYMYQHLFGVSSVSRDPITRSSQSHGRSFGPLVDSSAGNPPQGSCVPVRCEGPNLGTRRRRSWSAPRVAAQPP